MRKRIQDWGLLPRLWLALSVMWFVVFGYQLLSAKSKMDLAQARYEKVRVDAIAESMFQSQGIESYSGAANDASERRDELEKDQEQERSRFYKLLFLMISGPFVIGAILRGGQWVAAGAKTPRQ